MTNEVQRQSRDLLKYIDEVLPKQVKQAIGRFEYLIASVKRTKLRRYEYVTISSGRDNIIIQGIIQNITCGGKTTFKNGLVCHWQTRLGALQS